MKKILYLTPGERLVFDAVFNGAKEVEVKARGCAPVFQVRVGLANGTLTDLLTRLEAVVVSDAGAFLKDVMARLISAGILVRHGKREDTDLVGVLQVLVPREEVDCTFIKQREIIKLDGCSFDRIETAVDHLISVVSLPEFIKDVLQVPLAEAHKWATKLVSLGVIKNVAFGSQTARWIPVARGFEQHHFVREELADLNAGKKNPVAVPIQKPVEPKAEAVKPKLEPAAVAEPKEISLVEAIAFLIRRRELIKACAVSDRAMVVAEMEKIKNLLADEKKRLSEAITNGATFDNTLYNSLVEKSRYLENRLAQPDETELLKAYDAIVADLTDAFSQTHAFTFPEKSAVEARRLPDTPLPASPAPKPAKKPEALQDGVDVGKANPPTSPYRRSKTGLSALEIGVVALSRARQGEDAWLTMAEVMTLARKVDRTVKVERIVNAFCYEVAGRKSSGGQVERRRSNPDETNTRRNRFKYRLTKAGRLASAKIEKRLAKMNEKKTAPARRSAHKKGNQQKGHARTETRGVNSRLAKFTLCAATGGLNEWFTHKDLCELLKKDFPEIKSVGVCPAISTECLLEGGFFTRRQLTADDYAGLGLKDNRKVNFLYKLTDAGRAFAAKVANAESGSADSPPGHAASGKKDGKLNLGQRIASVWANTPSCRDNLTAAQIMVLAQSGDPELNNKQISQSLRSGYFCDLFKKIVPKQESDGRVALYCLTELARSMRKGN